MAKFLGVLSITGGVTLGPPVDVTVSGLTLQYYRPVGSGGLEKMMVVGVILESHKQFDGTTIVGTKELWSHGPGGMHAGYVFVRVWTGTQVHTVDVARPTRMGFSTLALEMPVTAEPLAPLANGATVICCVLACKTDRPGGELEQEGLVTRAYRLYAGSVFQLFKSRDSVAFGELTHQSYCPNDLARAEKVLVVGVVIASVKQSDGSTVLVLESPGPENTLLRILFRGQLRALETIALMDLFGIDTVLGSQEFWNQGTRRDTSGYVCIHLLEETQVTAVNVLETSESPVVPLAIGATLICAVYPCRQAHRLYALDIFHLFKLGV
ncbi:hypothetical protein C8F04DRAFT_1270217 [Mycena alexandri]|uniref:Uncharacterized protein n=1 Tax=Mycena alexandri TaxID=1745969 RepID=A0AAD6SD78_9AGAR|nr:hypothetical protein C8F04DRAFT_1270217 [Mycena alexandri]